MAEDHVGACGFVFLAKRLPLQGSKIKIGAAALLSTMFRRSNPFRVLGTPGPEGQLPVKRSP